MRVMGICDFGTLPCKRLRYCNRAVNYYNKEHKIVKEAVYGKFIKEREHTAIYIVK